MKKLQNEVMFFKQKNISKLIEIPRQEERINNILDTTIWADIDDIKLVETDKGVSYDGVCLTSKKIMAQLVIRGKITYVETEKSRSVHGLKFKFLKTIDIVVPEIQGGKSMVKLFRENRIKVIPHVEGIYSRKVDFNKIYTCIVMFVEATICS